MCGQFSDPIGSCRALCFFVVSFYYRKMCCMNIEQYNKSHVPSTHLYQLKASLGSPLCPPHVPLPHSTIRFKYSVGHVWCRRLARCAKRPGRVPNRTRSPPDRMGRENAVKGEEHSLSRRTAIRGGHSPLPIDTAALNYTETAGWGLVPLPRRSRALTLVWQSLPVSQSLTSIALCKGVFAGTSMRPAQELQALPAPLS